MKKLVTVLALFSLMSCSESKNDASRPQKKLVCADSFDQELFDTLGNSYVVRKQGDCDSVPIVE